MTAARRFAAALALVGLGGLLLGSTPSRAADPITVDASPIAHLDKASGRARFGAFDYVGGFQFTSRDSRLAGVSSIRLNADGTSFLAVTDLGSWFAGTIERDALERPVGITDAVIAPLLGADGKPLGGKIDGDAESLAVEDGRVLVGFERDHRILSYGDPAAPFDRPGRRIPLPLPRQELRSNRGMETIAHSPAKGPLAGAEVVVSERSLDGEGNIFAAIFDARRRAENGVFKVKRTPDWDVSDGTFLPGGDLLLLERKYTGPFGGLGIRIRRIAGSSIEPGALVDGPVVLDLDLGQEIDNMEGIDAWRDKAGAVRITLVSDDNASFFQRQLLLEFKLRDSGD